MMRDTSARHFFTTLLHDTSCSHHIPNNRDYKQKLSIKSTKKHPFTSFSNIFWGALKENPCIFE